MPLRTLAEMSGWTFLQGKQRLGFGSGVAGAEAVQPEGLDDAGGSQKTMAARRRQNQFSNHEQYMSRIIYLNGPSSSGKTTLAKALQDSFSDPYLHLGIDKVRPLHNSRQLCKIFPLQVRDYGTSSFRTI